MKNLKENRHKIYSARTVLNLSVKTDTSAVKLPFGGKTDKHKVF